ncbi:MAG: hypothetical protein KDJ44_07725 [Rhodoblastus sp.]|nr:hypothetical protein [Rhodoblastus sp.]
MKNSGPSNVREARFAAPAPPCAFLRVRFVEFGADPAKYRVSEPLADRLNKLCSQEMRLKRRSGPSRDFQQPFIGAYLDQT